MASNFPKYPRVFEFDPLSQVFHTNKRLYNINNFKKQIADFSSLFNRSVVNCFIFLRLQSTKLSNIAEIY